MNLIVKYIGVAQLICVSSLVHAEEDVIQTDRPDFVESSMTVGKQRFQFETSVSYETNHSKSENSHVVTTPTLLRYGIADDWELRLETDAWVKSAVEDNDSDKTYHATGWADYSLGMKWHQQDEDEDTHAPSIGWLFHVDMDSGSREFHSSQYKPSVRMVVEWELADDYSLGVMPGVIYGVNDQNDRYWGGIFAVVLGKSLSEKLRTFVELSGQEIRRSRDGGSQVTFDTGFAYLINNLTQIDIVYNGGLNKYTPDHTLGLGLSMKF